MALKTVQISECDRCSKDEARTWIITGPEGATREIELCDRHAAPVANLFALARPHHPAKPATTRRRTVRTVPQPRHTAPPPATLPPAPEALPWR